MIAYRCLGCGEPDLPIEVLRCPRCGEENFIPLNRPLSAPQSHPEPINYKKNFDDTSTEQTGEAMAILTDCSPNQHEETEPMSENIHFWNEEHGEGIDGINVKVKWSKEAGENNIHYQNINWRQKQQLQNCSSNPAIMNDAIQEIPSACDQASVSAHGEEQLNHQPESKRENEYTVDLSQFKNENGEIDFAGCNKCLRQFHDGQLSFDDDSKPNKCEKCLCRFDRQSTLKTHLAVHSEDRPFKCVHCGYTCKRKDYLEKHILNRHTKQ